MKDVDTALGLSREKLVRMALLLGSDYTDGVKGVGIVNAIEILQVRSPRSVSLPSCCCLTSLAALCDLWCPLLALANREAALANREAALA